MTIFGIHWHKWSVWEDCKVVASYPILDAFGHDTEHEELGQKRHCQECGVKKLRTIGR